MEVIPVFVIFLIIFAVFLFWTFSVAEGRQERADRRRRGRGRRGRSHSASGMSRAYSPPPRQEVRRSTPREERARRRLTATPSAQTAMQQAGYAAGPDFVQITDVGLLAYRQADQPRLIREGDVVMDAEYLRPFAELWVPFRSRGPVRFELVDGEGRVRYADEERYDLDLGVNTLLPGTWLPLQGKAVDPEIDWQLRIRAGQTLLAIHNFGWKEVGGGIIQQYIESDGEISAELRQMLGQSPREAVSLSDLLGDQADD